MYKHLFRTALWLMGLMGTLAIWVVNAQEVNKDIILEATATESGQTLKINKYFFNSYTVNWWDGSPVETVSAGKTHTYTWAWIYNIILSTTANRWIFQRVVNNPLVPINGTTMIWVKIVSMPSLEDWFGESATDPWNYFFNWFNNGWALTSLPEWSFDTSNISEVGDNFFDHFNWQWKLESLPEWSFNTSNISGSVWSSFFSAFNIGWLLTSLPEWSFDTRKITTVGNSFFDGFNWAWKLKSLPTWSFNIDNIITVWNGFFSYFNYEWQLISLPSRSFNTSNINEVKDDFFKYFNYRWKLESLPTWSFNIDNITTVWNDFFSYFNLQWKLESLPEWSFNTSNIKTVGNSFFTSFNREWKIISLPNGSFDTSDVSTAGGTFFHSFNLSWGLMGLPTSFKMSSVWASVDFWYEYAFNSPNTTLNKKVSDLVSWITVPLNDRNTFSDNQLWRCWVNANWLVNDYWCSIIYNINQWNTYTTTKKYPSNTTWDIVWSWIIILPKEGYIFNGWYTQSWEKVDEIIFPEMDGETLYAHYICSNWYIQSEDGKSCELVSVKFDANGWTFNDGTDIISISATKKTIIPEEFKMTHTINLTDEWDYIWQSTSQSPGNACAYANWSIWSWKIEIFGNSTWFIQIDWAESLNVSIKYGWSSYGNTCAGPIWIWTWNHTDYEPRDPSQSSNAIRYLPAFPIYGTFGTDYFVVQWDSISIVQSSWCPNYWWYITVRKEGVYEVVYESWAFDDIPQPTRDWHNFKWWYLADETKFNTWNVSTWEVTYVYAKWECAQWYVNKQWQCVKEETKPSWWSSGGWWGWGWWGGSSSSCKNLPANAVANNSSTPSSNTNYYYSTNTSKVCTFQCKSGYTRNAEKETCDKASDTQTTSWTTVKEPEGTWNNTKVETWNNTEIQTWSKIDTPEQASQDNKQDTQDSTTKTPEWKTNSTTSSTYSPEFQQAYEFAKWNWITTMPTIQKADMNGKLTRIAMAKMLSQYAINILWKTPDATLNNKFNDVTDKRDRDYDNWVTLAYQLWIMWQNMPWNKFRPDDEVSRAEFATALSRMLYNTSDWQYKSTDKYYTNHMSKLVKEWIITKDDPKMKELRWYVMIMLMRSSK